MAKPKKLLSSKDLVSIHDISTDEVKRILDLADELKRKNADGVAHETCGGKVLAMVFQKPSTRTRVSFETGIYHLGGTGLYLSGGDLQLGRGETIEDTARVLSRYVDGIMARVFAHDDVLALARYATIPVINGLSDLLHPCQALADIMTIREKKGELKDIKITYVGDGNNVAHSLLYAGAKTGMHVTIGRPEGCACDPGVFKNAETTAEKTGGSVSAIADPVDAVRDADVVYTDVWTSMGQSPTNFKESRPLREIKEKPLEVGGGEREKRIAALEAYQLNSELLSHAKPDAIVMHCLPAHRGEEITDEVTDGPQSVVFDQAENRLHVQKAIMTLLMGKVE